MSGTEIERRFSFRLLVLRILTVLMAVALAGYVVLILAIQSRNYESGVMGGIQHVLLEKRGIETWEELDPGTAGVMLGEQILPAIVVIVALIAVFRRMRKTAIVMFSLLVLVQIGTQKIPVIPAICLVVSCLPGRSRTWEK